MAVVSSSRLKKPSLCSFRLEREFNCEFTLGIDEVGRGPLAGPVVVAGVMFPKEFWYTQDSALLKYIEKINDSKRLREETREDLAEFIKASAKIWDIVELDAPIIDQINILQATFRGAREVVKNIESKLSRRVELIMFDGPHKIPMLDHQQHCVIGGDGISKTIAAASILAKVHRDRLMKNYEEKFLGYGFSSHKGYGTKQHLEAIDLLGMTPIHRRSFLKKYLAQDLGRASEQRVADYIEKEGFYITDRNWRMPSAEIDLIAEKNGIIHFFEIRSRSKPVDLQAVFSKAKQKQIEHAIQLYFVKRPEARNRRFHVHLATIIAGKLDVIWDVFKF